MATAEQASDPGQKAMLMAMAEVWRKLADLAESSNGAAMSPTAHPQSDPIAKDPVNVQRAVPLELDSATPASATADTAD